MKTRFAAFLVLLVMLPAVALGGTQYIIPDSDTRYLSEGELWEWSYESLGFILNEIFARHGYNFEPGGRYDNYFRSRPWYTPNADSNNSRACYPKLTNLEWVNERTIKNVREEMRARGDRNPNGKHYLDYVETGSIDVLSGFTYTSLRSGQRLSVYSAPSAESWRGANGKAVLSTNGAVYVAGWENGWLLVMYETNNGSVRVGYIDGGKLKGSPQAPYLNFAYTQARVARATTLTDDPVRAYTGIRQLAAGETVTYLSDYLNRNSWAYVETVVNGQTVRGFIPADALDVGMGLDENENG